ncbi:MAG: VWA domain-containing protein, partial [Rhodobacteraceae bacterium]|nr:VWA domain-containing protein [Paracoccaceae bacterium]
MFLLRPFVAFVLISLASALPLHAQDKGKTILVLDASGSMWGQIDGLTKIEIAQKVVGGLLDDLPADQELGLTAYGHNRKGDCSDIETLVQPGMGTRDAIRSAVNAIKPKGKTPLSEAVIKAAEALKYTEDKATVILVSDGRETCDFDPCEVGRRLEEAGVDFTAHVVGFDVANPADRAQLQCLAENTGGEFLTASNASELTEALQKVSVPEPPKPVQVTFRAIEYETNIYIEDGLIWSLT